MVPLRAQPGIHGLAAGQFDPADPALGLLPTGGDLANAAISWHGSRRCLDPAVPERPAAKAISCFLG
jgi:hypothetical protein